MKILIVGNSFPASRADWVPQFGYFFVKELIARGHAVTVVAPERYGNPPDEGEFKVIRIPAQGVFQKDEGLNFSSLTKIPAMMALDRRVRQRLDAFLREESFDLGLALWAFPSGWWLSYAKNAHGLPFITWVLGSDIWKTGRWPVFKNVVRGILRGSDHIFADGLELGAEAWRLCGKGVEFLPTSRKLPVARPVNDPQINGKKLFFFVGRWEHVKGVDVLIKAFAKAKPDKSVLLIYGLGLQENLYRQLIAGCGAQDFIFLRAQADAQTVADYCAVAHCCVIPSRNESIPIVLSDALQSYCPVIVTRVGDMGRLVAEYKFGLGVEADDADGLAAAITRMSQLNRDHFQEGAAAAWKVFDISAAVEKFLSVARQIALRS